MEKEFLSKHLLMGLTGYPKVPTTQGKVLNLWINKGNDHRDKQERREKPSLPLSANMLHIDIQGILGDKHYGFIAVDGDTGEPKISVQEGFLRRKSGTKDEPSRNKRMWSMISTLETAQVGVLMEIDIEPGWLKENITTDIPGLSSFPPGTMFVFCEPEEVITCILQSEYENSPCFVINNLITQESGKTPEIPFMEAAAGLRGQVGVVEKKRIY